MKRFLSALTKGTSSTGLVIPSRAQMRRHPLQAGALVLTPVEPADGPALWRAVDSSRATLSPWLPWIAFNVDESSSQRFAESCARDWDQGRALRLAIRRSPAEPLLGVVSLENCVHLHRHCSLGYWLVESATGQGLMTLSARACLQFGFEDVGFHRIACAAATENQRSLNVIARLGFKPEGTAREAEFVGGRWVDHRLFALLSRDHAVGDYAGGGRADWGQ